VTYIYQFDIAALFIEVIVFFFYFQKKNLPTLQNRIFFVALCAQIINTIIDLVTIAVEINFKSLPVNTVWFVECVCFTGSNIFGMLYSAYTISVIDIWDKIDRKKTNVVCIHLMVPLALALTLIWLSPVLDGIYPLVFTIDPEVGYLRNNTIWYYLLYVLNLLYIAFSACEVWKYRKSISVEKRHLLYFYVIAVLVGYFLQLMVRGLLVERFGIALATLVYFFYIQRPEEVVDSVTGSLNQTGFVRMTGQNFRNNKKFTGIFIVLDDTAFMTNTMGIGQLNNFLRLVQKYLEQQFSYINVFNLYQGCFCVLLKNPSEREINSAIKILTSRFQQNWIYNTVELKLYSRFCVVECPKNAQSPEEMIDIVNLVSIDDRYKKPVIFADEIDMEYKRRTQYIEHSLRNGLIENRFEVYYQPIYSVVEQSLIGAEALIRLRDENGKFISPEDFIPIAEKTGNILRIGEYVFETVCRNLSVIDIAEYGIKKIDINLSVAQCMQEILAEQILAINSIYKIPASIINLEITETAAAHTPEILLKNMQTLSKAGFELSLDDYGSGYSNMNYMLNLPFRMIKIDKYIVWAAYADPRAEKALAATIKMIKSLDMTVLAEGVEAEDQAQWLMSLGCDYLQGYYYSRPVPKNEYLELMKKNMEEKNN